MPQTVRINVHIDLPQWKPFIGPTWPTNRNQAEYTIPQFSLPDGPGNGPVHQGPLVTIVQTAKGPSLKIRGPVELKFCFPDAANNFPTYAGWRAVGLSFARSDGGIGSADDVDDLGRETIRFGREPQTNGTGFSVPFVSVVNKWETKNTPTRPAKWKYMILIQDCYGNVGLIDPDIENDADPA